MSCPTVLTHQHFPVRFPSCDTPAAVQQGRLKIQKVDAAMMANWGNCRICSENPFNVLFGSCPSSVPFSTSVLNSWETKEAPIAATCSGNGRAKVGSNQRRSAHQQPLGLHFLPGHRLDNPMKFAPGVEHGLTEVLLISFQELGYAWPYLLS